MKTIAFDTETSLIRPGQTAPPMTCLTWQEAIDFEKGTFTEARICLHTDARALIEGWLLDKTVRFVGQNVAFDMAVIGAEFPDLIPLIFKAYEDDRVTDTMLRQKLIDIAGGCYRGFLNDERKWVSYDYNLLSLARRLAGIPIKKEGFRLFYGPFRGVPLEEWLEHAKALQARALRWCLGDADEELEYLRACLGDDKKFRKELEGMIAADPHEVTTYPLDDARSTLAVWQAQEPYAAALEDQYRQARKAWWLHLTSAWGLRTNAKGVAALQRETSKECERLEERLRAEGLIRKDGSRDTKLAKARMLAACRWHWDDGLGRYVEDGPDSLPLRLTATNDVSLDSDACKAVEDELLRAYADVTSLKGVQNKDIPALARGVIYPVHTHFDLAGTGRVTSAGPNVQNWRRLPGIRECFTPRPGHVYAQADYSGLELATLAQACLDLLGRSALADALNAGLDPHTALAADILGISYADGERLRKAKDPTFDDARQTAKVANFGFPGGLGPGKLVLFARKTYGVELTEERARELKAQWLAKWPEMRDYFAHVNGLAGFGGMITLTQLRSGRIRGGARYTEACNSFFQGLGADATAAAGWLIAKACYLERSSPLFGCRIVNYIHDEFILEAPEERAAEAAEELSRLMVKGAGEWIPSIRLAAEPCLMRVWSKDAKTLRDAANRLMVWAP